MRPRAVVVGAGSAGSVLAARIADRYDVVLIEAGRWVTPAEGARSPDESIAHPMTWSLPASLTASRGWQATPGRAVGGSSVVNGGYFAVPEAEDLARWHEVGGPEWEPDRVRAVIAELGARFGVHPSPQTHPITRAFADAVAERGSSAGLLSLGTTFSDGAPRSVADAFLVAGAIDVRSNCRATRIIVEDGRATGVDVADSDGTSEVVAADEVVLCAGGFGTARLLLVSGLGPAAQLSAAGIEPVADLPGVGAAFSDHPTVWLEWVPTAALGGYRPGPDDAHGPFPLALRVGADGRPGDDLEILVCTQPPDVEAERLHGDAPFGLIVGLQRPVSRGTVEVASAHPFAAPRIAYGYLEDERDRAALRVGVRIAAEVLSSRAFAGVVERLVDLDAGTLGDDARLDAWIEDRLGSAAHTSGIAPMGTDALAVADGAGRVRGIRGLRIADTSLLPAVPSRAPAAAAMAVGAIVADQMVR